MPFRIIRNDITKVKADAIVNTANPKPVYAAGTDAAIYEAAGAKKLLAERERIGDIETGQVAVTRAFALKAKYIIHTVGPAWVDGEHGEREAVRDCYRNSLEKAGELGCKSIAFPLIATGIYGFPKADALQIAVSAFSEFLAKNDMHIILVVFDEDSFVLSGKIFSGVDEYIDANYVSEKIDHEYALSAPASAAYSGAAISDGRRQGHIPDIIAETELNSAMAMTFADECVGKAPEFEEKAQKEPAKKDQKESAKKSKKTGKKAEKKAEKKDMGGEPELNLWVKRWEFKMPAATIAEPKESAPQEYESEDAIPEIRETRYRRSFTDLVNNVGESWQESLFRLIDEKGYTDTEVYKRANIDRKLFSKIRSHADYQPKKITAIAFALALRLSLDETKDMLGRAGYALSPSSKFDLIIRYFIEHEVYDTYTINLALFDHDQPLLYE